MNHSPFRLRLFAILIAPADLWIRLAARLCGVHYEPFFVEVDGD